MLQWCSGRRTIASSLLPFILSGSGEALSQEPARPRILEDVDAFLFEMSELRQIRYRDVSFQIQAFTSNFISKHGSAVLPWYRLFSQGLPVSDELVQETLSKLTNLAGEERELTGSILREARLEVMDVESTKHAIVELTSGSPDRWTFVSHFVVPGLAGTLMQGRAELRAVLAEAAAATGAGFFDPSEIVATYGRETVLANRGADIYHYDPEFQSTIAEILVQHLRARDGRKVARKPPSEDVSIQVVGGALNALLISLHRERLRDLDVDGSGLHQHYAALLEQHQIVSKGVVDTVDLILKFLPSFDCYHVLRAGLGEMAFLLAAFGCKVTAFDPFSTRLSAIKAGVAHLKACNFPNAGDLTANLATVPDVAEGRRTLAVATHLLITASSQEEEAILARLEKYDAILFDPALLVRARESHEERESLIDRFRRSGFTHIRDYPRLGLIYCAKNDVAASV